MSTSPRELACVYQGWEGYNTSLINAVKDLSPEQLAFRSVADMRSVGEVATHIASGRVDWFRRIGAPGADRLQEEAESIGSSLETGEEIAGWLNRTWQMVEATLSQWTVDDLEVSFNHPYQGKVYAVSRQWVIWRIMAHDIHHGGQLSEQLAMQGVLPPELTYLGGHLTEPPVVG